MPQGDLSSMDANHSLPVRFIRNIY